MIPEEKNRQSIWRVHGYIVFNTERLGKGSFGNVYLAQDKDGRQVAAKEIIIDKNKPHYANDAVKFYNKIPSHENIIKIHDLIHITEKRQLWIFMEVIQVMFYSTGACCLGFGLRFP